MRVLLSTSGQVICLVSPISTLTVNNDLVVHATFEDAYTDTDSDGLTDPLERQLGSDPNNPDSDSDGLPDGDEVNVYSTSPLNSDSDGDFYSDADEITSGTDPNDFDDIPFDLSLGLVAKLPFDGNANDESGNRNSGSPKNTTEAFNRNGEASKAFDLDGVGSYIDLSNRSGWQPGAGDFSFFLWFRTEGGHSADAYLISN